MRRAFAFAILVAFSLLSLSADAPRYFPSTSLSTKPRVDELLERWYSWQLKALGEKSLCCTSAAGLRTFRFTWLRTFNNPVAIRLEEHSSGNWTVHIKVADGAGGYDPGELIVNESHTLSAEKIAPLLGLLDTGSAFWAIPSIDEDRIGMDGSRWIIEVRHGGRYHFVDRWTPHDDPVYRLGKMFIEMSGRTFKEVY